MDHFITMGHAADVMRNETGIVVPVYLPKGIDVSIGERLLRDTVHSLVDRLSRPSSLCLCVDGSDCGEEITSAISRKYGTSSSQAPVNKGKLNAIYHGMDFLMDSFDHRYLAVVDQDGDHFANELENLVRAGEHIKSATQSGRVMVLGQRRSKHRPMGFLRGEIEELADRMLLDALQYRAAVLGRPLHLEYVLLLDEYPDFHSGLKLFDRETTESIFRSDPVLAGTDETCYYRHGVEAVLTVEALESGAFLGSVTRSTINEQPISTFGMFDRIQLAADKIIWPCRRLDIPGEFVQQWLANHIPRLLLSTMSPGGVEEMEKIRLAVLRGIDAGPSAGNQKLIQPLFV